MDSNRKGNREFFNNDLLFRTVGVIFLVIILVLVVADYRIYQKKQQLAARIETYKSQIENIQKSSQTLKDEISNADNVDYLEKLAYEQLNQTRPGETEYIFVKPETETETTSGSEGFWSTKFWFSWLGQSWSWIKNRF